METREDLRLLTAVGEGDAHALRVLYQRRGDLIYSLLVRMLNNEMEAQEIMQDTFLQLWRNAGEYDAAQAPPLAWVSARSPSGRS